MGSNASRNLEDQRREQDGIVYFDRGTLTGKNGRKYDRYAIQTHFIEVGEDQAEIVRRYVLPLYREGDVLSFGAKVMAMCTRNVFTKEQIKPGFWAKLLSPTPVKPLPASACMTLTSFSWPSTWSVRPA